MKVFSILFIVTFVFLPTGLPQNASKPRLVRNLIREELAGDCGCYFRFRGANTNSHHYMFVEPADDDSWMNIEGKDIRLRLIAETDRANERVGSRHVKKYVGEKLSVSGTYVATRVCKPGEENCGSHEYKAQFVVRKGRRVETVKATGWCGC